MQYGKAAVLTFELVFLCKVRYMVSTWISQLYLGLLQLFLLMIFQMSHSGVESPCIHVVSTADLSEGLRGSSPGRRAQTSLMGGHMMVGVSLSYYCRVTLQHKAPWGDWISSVSAGGHTEKVGWRSKQMPQLTPLTTLDPCCTVWPSLSPHLWWRAQELSAGSAFPALVCSAGQ